MSRDVSREVQATAGDGGLLRGVISIVGVGVALGIAFNWLGLGGQPAWGLAWIATDRAAEMASLESVAAAPVGAAPAYDVNDPMAVPPDTRQADGLPQIPDLGRPVKIDLGAVKQLLDAGAALVIDAREPGEFAAGRIPGAISMPYDEVSSEPERLENLESGGKPIIVYCGGGRCELSLSLAWDLIHAGQSKVVVYEGGFPEWEAAGHPVERGAPGAA
jgi:rhodanese-related sulfurtransferase